MNEEHKWIGKTIKNAYMGYEDFLIRFTDDTILKLHSRSEYDSVSLDYDDNISFYDHYKLGMISKEEYDSKQEQLRKDQENQRIKWEMQQLEQLKRKYETKSS